MARPKREIFIEFKQALYNKVKAYCESEYLRLIVLAEPPNLESFHKLKPAERYVEVLKQRTESACLIEKLRILPEMLKWVEDIK